MLASLSLSLSLSPMAGLLAWAADVVAGNGQQQQEEEEEQEAPWRGVRMIRLSAEEQEEVRQLEERAAALQHTIQHLRLRIPPPDISRSLPQLHADSLAAHSVLTSELNAHQTTQKESQAREASLRAENAAYAKAILDAQKQLQGKCQELLSLNSRLQELEQEELLLRAELDRLPRSSAEKEGAVLEETERASTTVLSSSDKNLKEGEELQKTRTELRIWEMNVARLEQEWFSLLQNSSKWPSAAQREKELERRLRVLSEQLMAKQGQADALVKERNTLQLRVRQASEIRQQGSPMNIESSNYKGKTRKVMSTLSSGSGVSFTQEFKSIFQTGPLETDQPAVVAAMRRVFRLASDTFLTVLSSRRTNNREIATNLCTSSALRCFIILYVLILHMVPFAVILSAT